MRKGMRQAMTALAAVGIFCMVMATSVPAYAADGIGTGIEEPEDRKELETGSVSLTLSDGEDKDKKLSGGVFAVYEAAGAEKAGELVTGKDGRAFMELPRGDYILRESAAPEGYLLSGESACISVQPGEAWELAFANEREEISGRETLKEEEKKERTGTLEIINAGAGTGEKLSGGVFAVFVSSGRRIGEVTAEEGGAKLSLPAGDYYLKEREAPAGYLLEKARILFRVREGEVTLVEITSERDGNYLVGRDPREIIPKTGEGLPVLRYVFAAFCFGTAALCGFYLRRR